MQTLDRYIARQYLTNVVVLLVILFSFVVVIDASLNLSRFSKAAAALASGDGEGPGFVRRALTTLLVVADLWWPRLLQLFNFMLGLVMVAAMGFTATQLSRHREFTAMLAAGISLHRVGRPILLVAALLSVVQLANQELVIPRIAPLLERDHGDAGRRGLGTTSIALTPDAQGRLFRAGSFDADAGTLSDVFVMERDANRQATRIITAESAVWRDDGWDLTGGFATARGVRATGRAPVPVDRIETGLGPTELKLNQFRSYRNAVSFSQASRILSRRDLLDDENVARLERIRWGRLAVVCSNLLTLVVAMPFFVTREPVSMVAQSLKCSPITITALMGGVLGASSGIPGLPAALGVFVPVMLLITVAIAARSFVRT